MTFGVKTLVGIFKTERLQMGLDSKKKEQVNEIEYSRISPY